MFVASTRKTKINKVLAFGLNIANATPPMKIPIAIGKNDTVPVIKLAEDEL